MSLSASHVAGSSGLVDVLFRDGGLWAPSPRLSVDQHQDGTGESPSGMGRGAGKVTWMLGPQLREPRAYIEWRIKSDNAMADISWFDLSEMKPESISGMIERIYSFRSKEEFRHFWGLMEQHPDLSMRRSSGAFLANIFASDQGMFSVVEPMFRPDQVLEISGETVLINRLHALPGAAARASWRARRRTYWRHLDAMWDSRGEQKISALFVIDDRLRKATSKEAWTRFIADLTSLELVDECFPHREALEKRDIADALLGVTTMRKLKRTLSGRTSLGK